MLVIGVVALIAIGPKELPGVLRMVGQWMGKIRRMASEFQGQFQEAMREAEMADLKKQVDDITTSATSVTNFDPLGDISKQFETAIEDKPAQTATPRRAGALRRRAERRAGDADPVPQDNATAAARLQHAERVRCRRAAAQGRERRVMRSEDDEKEIEASKAPLMEHLIELRSRLIKAVLAFFIAAVICFFFAKQIYNMLVWPYVWIAGVENTKFIYTALLEYFITQLKLAMFGAAFIAFPIIATQIYMFVAPGLYRNERQAFVPYLIATPIFFVLGAMVVYFLVMPMLVRFSLGMQQSAGRRPRRDRAAAQGRRIPVADDEPDAGVRRRVPASGDPDAARPHRHRHLADAAGEAALFHRRRLRDRGGADAARCAQPDVARDPADAALRAVDLVGEDGRGQGAGAARGRRRQPGGVGRDRTVILRRRAKAEPRRVDRPGCCNAAAVHRFEATLRIAPQDDGMAGFFAEPLL